MEMNPRNLSIAGQTSSIISFDRAQGAQVDIMGNAIQGAA